MHVLRYDCQVGILSIQQALSFPVQIFQILPTIHDTDDYDDEIPQCIYDENLFLAFKMQESPRSWGTLCRIAKPDSLLEDMKLNLFN